MYRLVSNYPIVMGKTALTVLVQQQDVSAVKVDGVSGTQAGQTGADDDDSLRHCEGYIGGYGDREGFGGERKDLIYLREQVFKKYGAWRDECGVPRPRLRLESWRNVHGRCSELRVASL